MDDVSFTDQIPEEELEQIEKEYKRKVAIVTVGPILKKIFWSLWGLFIVGCLVFFIWAGMGYLVNGQFQDRRLVATGFINWPQIKEAVLKQSASSLVVGDISVINTGDDRYDFFTTLRNPNNDWYAEFDYYFKTADGETDRASGFIMPNETKPVVALWQNIASIKDAELIVSNIEWTRVDKHQITDINTWLAARSNFTVSDIDFSRDVKIGDEKIPHTSFSVTNNSSYNFWQADFYIVLSKQGRVVGVNQFSIPAFEVGETRKIDLNWFNLSTTSADVNIFPSINYFDDSVYMPQSGLSQ